MKQKSPFLPQRVGLVPIRQLPVCRSMQPAHATHELLMQV